MWRSLGLALALCLLPCGGTESQGQSSFCKKPPAWSIGDQDPMLNSYSSVTVVALLQASWHFCLLQASSLEDLRVKLEKEGFSNISYVVVNHQGTHSRLNYMYLKNKVSEHIPVYQQEENQTDVWTLLNGNKDDFLIYDRCGRLVYHIGWPFSILSFSYVEEAIKIAYCEKKCGNCSLTTLKDEDFCKNVSLVTVRNTTEAPQPHHHHAHGHQHVQSGQPSENQQPEVPNASEHPPPPSLHHHHKLKDPHRQDHAKNWDVPVLSSLSHKKLWGKRWINQLHWKLPKDSELAPRSWCWHCRHLVFENTGSAIIWQCKENLPSLCSWQGLWAEENVIESWQWRLPPAAWQTSQQLQPTEASSNWSWKNKAEMWKWPSN